MSQKHISYIYVFAYKAQNTYNSIYYMEKEMLISKYVPLR